MAIRKRGGTWQIDYLDPGGKRVRQSFKTRKEAQAELGKRVSLIAEGRYLDVKPESKTTLSELCKKYTESFSGQSSFKNAKEKYLSILHAYIQSSDKHKRQLYQIKIPPQPHRINPACLLIEEEKIV